MWGSWAGKTPRAAQQIRILGAMLRFAGGHEHGGSAQEDPPSSRSLLRSALWEPYSPIVATRNATQAEIYASTWPSEGEDGELYISLVVLADRSAALGKGTVTAQFVLDPRVSGGGYHCYDTYRGREVPMPAAGSNNTMTVEVDASLGGSDPAPCCARSCAGIGGLLFSKATPATDSALANYLKRMQAVTARSLADFTCEGGPHCFGQATGPPPVHSAQNERGSLWPFYDNCSTEHCAGLTQRLIPIPQTSKYATAPTPGMVPVPGGAFLFSTRGVEIEGAPGLGVDIQLPWEEEPGRFFPKPHSAHRLQMPPLWADQFPVTNGAYASYLAASNFTPADQEHWLEH